MSKDIRVARLVAPGKPFELGTAPMPEPGTNDVLVRVKACNVVPNAVNVASGKGWYVLPDLPAIFGLDASGIVEKIGRNVLDVKVGDRVYVDPLLECGECRDCRRGRAQYCRYSALRGYISFGPNANALQRLYPYGGMSEYLISPSTKVARLPDNIDFDTAARFGYLGTSYAALLKGKVHLGSTLLINGVTGTLGVGAVQIALGLGVRRIFGIGRNQNLMTRIKALAPDRIELSTYDAEKTVQWVRDRTDGYGVETMYDCLGAGASADTTTNLLKAIAPNGSCVIVAGGVEGDIKRNYVEAMVYDIRITGSNWFTSGQIDEMIDLVSHGTIDLSTWETRAFPLEQVNDALALAGSRPGGFVNVVINP